MLCFGPIGMDWVLSESCYKGTLLQNNYRTLPFHGHFPIIPRKTPWYVKKFGSHNMTVLYRNTCYYEVCYKWTELYLETTFFTCDCELFFFI